MDPRDWGRIPQGALVLFLLLRLPVLARAESAAGLVGRILGLILGSIVVIGLLRLFVVSIQGQRSSDDSAAT